MSAPTKEYQPLLPSSDEETQVCSGSWRRHTMNGAKNRAASKMRGAAYVMRLWPDQLSSTLYNCWLALFMMVFMFTAMFGILMTFSSLPDNQLRFNRGLAKVEAKPSHLHKEKLKYTTVYCPVIKSANFNLSKYVTSFAYLRARFPMYKYNIIVLVNNPNETTDKDNNVVAMNTVLNRGRNKNRENLTKEIEHLVSGTDNLAIRVQTLADFMHDSPWKKNWKQLSKTLMPFLIQSVAIWQNGGISFNLNALVNKNSNRFKKYVEKVLKDFPKEDHIIHSHVKLNNNHGHVINLKPKIFTLSKKPVNNIRDVINNIKNDNSPHLMQANLMGEDSKIVGAITHKTKRSLSVVNSSKTTFNHTNASALNKSKIDHKHKTEIKKHKTYLPKLLKIMLNAGHSNVNKSKINTTTTKKTDHKILPKKTDINLTHKRESLPTKHVNSTKQNINITKLGVHISTSKNISRKENVNKGNIIKKVFENRSNVHKIQNIEKNDISQIKSSHEKNVKIVLDMKGEVIATKASCHAFIGHIFSTVQKYPAVNSIPKLINYTLKTFCVVPSNCIGIRLLL